MRRTVIKLGPAFRWGRRQVVKTVIGVGGVGAARVLVASGKAGWSIVGVLLEIAAIGIGGEAFKALFTTQWIALTDDALCIRDARRGKAGAILIHRRDVIGAELLAAEPVHAASVDTDADSDDDGAPVANLRIELTVAAPLRLRSFRGLLKRRAPDSVRARLMDGNSITCHVRDTYTAYPLMMNWIATGPGGPAARRSALTRIARAMTGYS